MLRRSCARPRCAASPRRSRAAGRRGRSSGAAGRAASPARRDPCARAGAPARRSSRDRGRRPWDPRPWQRRPPPRACTGAAGSRRGRSRRGAPWCDRHAPLELAGVEAVGPETHAAHRPQVVVLRRVLAHAAVDEAPLELLERDLEVPRRAGAGLAAQRGRPVGMEPLEVDRVDGVLLALEPVARDLGEHDLLVAPLAEEVPVGHERRGRGAEVRPEQPRLRLDGIGRGLDLVLEARLGARDLLERLVQARARAVEEPAVVVAAQAALLRNAVAESGAPVRAVAVEQAVAAARVPVENEVLAHEAHGQRRMLVELRDGGDGLPVAAHQLAHRRAAADAREPLVPLRAQHGRARRMIPSLPDRNRRRCAMRRHRPVAGSLVAALLTLGLVAPAAGQPAPAGEAVMAWHVTISPTWFDPSTAPPQITPFGILYALHDALVKPLPNQKMGASLAESWTESPDGLVYEFKLRRGLRFHNGDPLTTEDVKFSFERYKGTGAKELQSRVQQVEIVDPLTVRFHLKEPWPDFMTFYGTTATAAGIVVPKKYLTQVGEDAFRRHPIGAGPYRYVSHTPGVDVVLEA